MPTTAPDAPRPRRARLYRWFVTAASVVAFAGLSVDMAASAPPPMPAAQPSSPGQLAPGGGLPDRLGSDFVRHRRHHFRDLPGGQSGSPFLAPGQQAPAFEPTGPS
ncbi:MAG: hypothetical protein IMW98_00055 [Firmicutes bacterium]|nr:hypothetical protein [Bacillota bacterium]